MGRNRVKGGRQREKEREGEREVGEGLRAREEGSREERAERRERADTGRGYLLHHGTARSGMPTITFALTSPKVALLTTPAARWAGDCCKNDMFYNAIARQ